MNEYFDIESTTRTESKWKRFLRVAGGLCENDDEVLRGTGTLRFRHGTCMINLNQEKGSIRRVNDMFNWKRFGWCVVLSTLIAICLRKCCCVADVRQDDDDENSIKINETERQRFRAETRLNTAIEMSRLREYVIRNKKTVMGKLSDKARSQMLEWIGDDD